MIHMDTVEDEYGFPLTGCPRLHDTRTPAGATSLITPDAHPTRMLGKSASLVPIERVIAPLRGQPYGKGCASLGFPRCRRSRAPERHFNRLLISLYSGPFVALHPIHHQRTRDPESRGREGEVKQYVGRPSRESACQSTVEAACWFVSTANGGTLYSPLAQDQSSSAHE